MNASQLTLIREAKRILEDCSCFRGPQGPQGPIGPQGSTIVGPTGPSGTITDFSIPGASTNSLMYYTGFGFGAMSSLFYYSSINVLSANLDIIPCSDNTYNLGSSNLRWKHLYVGPSSIYIGNQAKLYEDVLGNLRTDIGYSGPMANISSINTNKIVIGNTTLIDNISLDGTQLSSLTINNSLIPISTLQYDLGNPSKRWRSIYIGPGTINIATNSTNIGTIGTDLDGIVYSQFGFATPFINIGPEISTNNAIGGWRIQSLNQPTDINFDLVVQQNTSKGLVGPTYSLIYNKAYVSTSQLTSTIQGLGSSGYISSSQLTSTVTGLGNIYLSTIFTAPSTTQAITSTVNGLGNIYVSSLVKNSFGKTLRVDSLYGNDTIALANQYSFPFSTISVAMYCASTSDQIWLFPGEYNEKVVFKSGVNMRGVNLNSVSINQSNVIQDTTLVKMASNTRLEDVTLNLTSKTPLASTLIGVNFSSCQGFAKLRASVINVNNTGLLSNTVPTNLYGIYSSGHSSTIYNSFDEVQRTTINVIGTGTGNKRGIYNDDSNKMSLRDVNIYCANTCNTPFSGGTYFGAETFHSNSILQFKSCSIAGSNFNNDIAADINQARGEIIVGFTDLINKTANNNALTVNGTQSLINFGVSGALSNFTVFTAGPKTVTNNWSNSFLVPGTLSFTTINADIITNYNGIRIANTNLVTTFGIQSQTAPGAGISTFAVLYKNGVALPNFTVPLVGANTVAYLSTSTVTIKNTDTFAVYLSTSVINTSMSNVVISANFF